MWSKSFIRSLRLLVTISILITASFYDVLSHDISPLVVSLGCEWWLHWNSKVKFRGEWRKGQIVSWDQEERMARGQWLWMPWEPFHRLEGESCCSQVRHKRRVNCVLSVVVVVPFHFIKCFFEEWFCVSKSNVQFVRWWFFPSFIQQLNQ